MHCDLLELTAGKIMLLAKVVSPMRLYPPQVIELVKASVNSGSLDPTTISEAMKRALSQ